MDLDPSNLNLPINLPEDFLEFLQSNYKRIEEVHQKIRDFSKNSWRTRQQKFGSYESSQSDPDVISIISAKVKPKLKHALAVEESFEAREHVTDQIHTVLEEPINKEGFDPDSEELARLQRQFPMVSFVSGCNKMVGESSQNKELPLYVKGTLVHLIQRDVLCKGRRGKGVPPRKKGRKRSKNPVKVGKSRKKVHITVPTNDPPETSTKRRSSTHHRPKLINDLIVLELYKEYLASNFQLTLPPLHSSVLTLLGQNSPFKGTPRNPHTPTENANVASRQKLRRHGRRSKKEKQDDEEDGRNGGEKKKAEGGGVSDDPNETQVSVFQEDDPEDIEEGSEGSHEEDEEQGPKRLVPPPLPRKSLAELLDEKLVHSEWNPKEMKGIDQEIEILEKRFNSYETKFKPGNLTMNEDQWLVLPRTCSKFSATFGVPSDTRLLKTLTPIEYLRRFVDISDARKHLFSLVFHRYRSKENPMKKTISLPFLEMSLFEVIGRPLTSEEWVKLKYILFNGGGGGDTDQLVQIDEDSYRGICAFVERLFGKYTLEESANCFYCSTTYTKDKTRCHKKDSNQLERADFEYIQSKIKEGGGLKGNPLSYLLQTIHDLIVVEEK